MAAAPTNLLLAQNFTAADLNSLARANSPAISGGPPPGAASQNGLQFQTREEAQMFLQAAGRANGSNPAGGITLTRDAVAALQHAAQVAAVNQAKMVPHANGANANGNIRSQVSVVPSLGQGQNQALANLHTQAQLQAAMNAQRAAAQAAAAQQTNGLSAANNQAALFLVQNQIAQAQAANNAAAQVNPFGLQNGLQNNPIAAAAAAAAAVAATTQAAQARAGAVGNANSLLQLQQAAQAAVLQRPQQMTWPQNQALQNAAIAQHNLAQQNLAAAQNNPALLAAALQAQQARAALQVQQLAAQQQAISAAAARPLNSAQQNNVAAAQQLQVLRQLQARLNAAQAPNALAAAAAAAPAAAAKPTEAQLQALRTALARSAAGRAALNAANVLGASTPRSAMPQSANGSAAPALNPLQQAINLQLLLQQQRNAVQVQQAQVTAMANNLAANLQSNAAAAALNGQLAALQQAAAASAVANGQRPVLQANTAAALAGIGGVGTHNAGSLNEAMLQNLQKMQLAKAMQDSAAAAAVSGLTMPAAEKVTQGGDAAATAATNSSKEQRRLALACVALQLARGGMTVEQAINSGIMGGMSVTDVKFIVECYNAERQRMQSEGAPAVTGATPGASSGGAAMGPGQHPGAPPPSGMPQQGVSPGLPGHGGPAGAGGLQGLAGHMHGPVDLGMHGHHMGGLGGPPGMMSPHGPPPNVMQHGPPPNVMQHQPPLPFSHSPSAPASPAVGDPKDAAALAPSAAAAAAAMGGVSRLGPNQITGHASAPVSPPRTTSQGSPTIQRPRLTGAGSDIDGAAHETRSEGGASVELAADAAAAVAALSAKEPFDAFSYAFFGATDGPGMGELLGELETADGELESGAVAPLDAEAEGESGALAGTASSGLRALGELDPDQAAWLRAAASANQAMWAGEGAEDGPMSNDEIAARLANLDLGSGFF